MVMADGTTYRFITDHLGSVRLVLNVADGTVVQRINYDAFGRVIQDTNHGFQPFGFAGGLYERDTGFVRFGARDYEAHTGRWTAKDPVMFEGGVNFYVYAYNDPVNFVDLTGLRPLTTNEKQFLDQYFGGSLDTSSIDIGSSIGSRSWSPYGNRISLTSDLFSGGCSGNEVNLSDPSAASTFAHEARYVWQRQRGRWVTTEGILLQAGYSLGIRDPYAYSLSPEPDVNLQTFLDGSIEQQGQMFED